MARQARGQGGLARVAERRVAQVVAKRDGFGEVFVEAERAGDGARDLRHFKRVREPRAEMVALGSKEHLRFVRQASEAFRVQDLIAVALIFRAQEVGLRRLRAAFRFVRERGVGRQKHVLALLLVFTVNDVHDSPLALEVFACAQYSAQLGKAPGRWGNLAADNRRARTMARAAAPR